MNILLPAFRSLLGRLRLLPLLLLAAALPAAESEKKTFDLPADAAERTLKLFATQSGIEVLFLTEVTRDIRTVAVRGKMTPLEAVHRMLDGTDLQAEQNARTGAITVVRRLGAGDEEKNDASRRAGEATADPQHDGIVQGTVTDRYTHSYLTGAVVSVPGTGQFAITGRDGSFVLRGVAAGLRSLAVTYSGYNTETCTVEVAAGLAASLEVKLDPEVMLLSEFRVEGAREGQARAINEQRSAVNIKNIVAADAIGNFPDINAAEALKRMAGISTVRQRGEDRDITIRGAAPNLNAITLDGVSILSNQVDGRTVSMDVYPAEQLAGIEVTKSATPDMDGDSIGGAINLRSKSAFDSPGRVATASAYWQYNDMAEKAGYRLGLNYSNVFGAARDWGLQFSFSRSERNGLEQTAEPSGWGDRSGTASNGAYAGTSPNNLAFADVDILRERTGGSFSVERKFGPDTRLFVRASYNEFIETNGRPRFVVQNVGTVSASYPVTIDDGRLVSYTSQSARGQRIVNPRYYTDTGSAVAFGGETVVSDWRLSLTGSWARGTNHQDSYTGQWRSVGNSVVDYDLTDTDHPRFTVVSGTDLYDASTYAFNKLQIQDRRLLNQEYAFKGDAARDFLLGGYPLTFSTGFKYRWSPKRWDQQSILSSALVSGTLALDDARLGGVTEVDASYLGGLMAFGPTISPFAFRDFVDANLDLFKIDAGSSLQNSLGDDYYVAEEVTAGYLMGEWSRERLTALAGLRYERTATTTKAYSQDTTLATSDPARYTWTRHDAAYDNLLPGIHLRYKLTKRLILRASWNKTFARPETNRLAPTLDVTMPTSPSESDPVIVSGGNPDLHATTSDNFDFSVEYYFKGIGLVSAGYFYKRLDGPIYRHTYTGTYEGDPARFTVYGNAGKAWVSGCEFTYQQQFTALPPPFDAFGVYANLTLVDSEVTLTEPDREGEKLPLFNQSKQLGNLALTYQKHGVFVRLSHNWRGSYLQTLGDPGFDEYAGSFHSFDLLASVRLSNRWNLKFEASNLTDEPEEQYVGESGSSNYYGDTGRSYSVGLTFNY